MGRDSFAVQLTGTATTTLGTRFLMAICVNKTLIGTMVIKDGATTVGSFAIGTVPNTYHVVPNGARYQNLQVVLSAGDDVTAYIQLA